MREQLVGGLAASQGQPITTFIWIFFGIQVVYILSNIAGKLLILFVPSVLDTFI